MSEEVLKFGTSGVRGLATQFTDQEVFYWTYAFLLHAQKTTNADFIYLGQDLRESSPGIFAACLFAIHQCLPDLKIRDCGVCATPSLSFTAQGSWAIMITGSHIPADRNGIKFYLASGETLKSDDNSIAELYHNLKSQNNFAHLFTERGARKDKTLPEYEKYQSIADRNFRRRYEDFFPHQPLKGLKIIFYEHSSVARDIMPQVLENLGAKVLRKGREDHFVPVDTEAVYSLDRFKEWILTEKADALVSTDGDADRPLFLDGKGEMIPGDQLGFTTSLILGIKALVMPISCNSSIASFAEFEEVLLTQIGSPYVVAGLQNIGTKYKIRAGFEANGGYLLDSPISQNDRILTALPTRDSFLPVICALIMTQRYHKPLSEILNVWIKTQTASVLVRPSPVESSKKILNLALNSPQRFLESLELPTSSKVKDINTVDGVRLCTDKNEIFHFRPSGNAPELRCYIEAQDQTTALRYSEVIQRGLKKILHSI